MPAALDSKRQCDEPEWSEKMENNSNKLLKIISICLAAAVIVSAGVGVFLWKQIRGSSGEKIKIIKRTESIAEILGKDDSLGKVDIGRIDLSQDSGTVAAGNENVPIYATGRLSKYVTSVLLVVQDGHTSSKPKQADAVILFSYNEATQKISVLSMLRDCWFRWKDTGLPDWQMHTPLAEPGFWLIQSMIIFLWISAIMLLSEPKR